jgi:hypothetical protein
MSSDHKNTDTGFKIPSDYFEGMADRLLSNLENSKVQKTGFEVSENYFETLTEKVIASVNRSNDEVKVIPFQAKTENDSTSPWLVPLLSIAAIGLLLFSLQGLWSSAEGGVDSLGDEEMMNYVLNLEDGMDQEAIDLLFYDNNILDEISMVSEIKEDELHDYLMEEVDINLIYP